MGRRYLCATFKFLKDIKHIQTCPTLSSGLSGDDMIIRSSPLKAWSKCMKPTWSLLAGHGGGSTEHEARYCENVIFNSCPSEPAASTWPRRHYQRSKTLESNWWTVQAKFWNASSRHTIRHCHIMKHVMPSIPTVPHLTNTPHLCQ